MVGSLPLSRRDERGGWGGSRYCRCVSIVCASPNNLLFPFYPCLSVFICGFNVYMQKESNRPRRVAELIKRELALLIPRELNDPSVHKITLTGAEVARDLAFVRIYFSLLGSAEEAKKVAKALNRAAGFLRHALSGRLVLRTVPELRFYFDESVERGARIDSLIERALTEDKTRKE